MFVRSFYDSSLMKYFIGTIIFLASILFVRGDEPDSSKLSECGARITVASFCKIGDGKSSDANVKNYTYPAEGMTRYVVCAERFNKNPNEWEKLEFSFEVQTEGIIGLSLSSTYPKKKENAKRKFAVYYDNLKINGKLYENGDFENGLENFSSSAKYPPKIEKSPKFVKYGKSCLRVWSHSYTGFNLKLKKGDKITVSVMIKPAGELVSDDDSLLSLPDGIKAESINLQTDEKGEAVFDSVRFNTANPVKLDSEPIVINLKDKSIFGRYVYILHSMSDSNCVQNQDIGRVFIKTKDGKLVKHLLAYGRDMLDENKYEPAINAKAVFFKKPKNKKGALYFSRFEVPSNEAIESILINRWLNFNWNIVAVTVSDKKVNPYEEWTPTAEEWKVADIPEDPRVIKGSALDLSHFYHDGEAGKFGRVVVSERGTFAFENDPKNDVRFKSFMMSMGLAMRFFDTYEERKAVLKEYAEQIKLAGYNAVRIDFDFIREYERRDVFEKNVDLVDFFMAEMKKNGIYIHYTIGWRDFGFNPKGHPNMRDEMKMRCVMNDPDVLSAWKKWAEFHLNHVNPYTKLALKDDPQVIQVEYFNELSITMGRIDRMPPDGKKEVIEKFQNWLKEKYGTIENLNAAWNKKGFVYNSGSFKYKDFSEVKTFFQKNPDWMEFYATNKRKFFDFCTKVVRGTGYKGIITSENIGASPEQCDIQNGFSESTSFNTYFDHPVNIHTDKQSVSQQSSIAAVFPNISSLVSRHFNNRPIGITEYNHCFWNKHRHEILATFAPYCAYQDFSMLTLHEDAVPYAGHLKYKRIRKMNPFRASFSPLLRVSEVFSTCFFARGDIKPAKNRIEMRVTKDLLKNDYHRAQKAFNVAQTRLALLTGFRIDCEGEAPESLKRVKVPVAKMKMDPIGSSKTRMDDWFQTVEEDTSSESFDVVAFVEKMRKRGILTEDNKTNIKKGIFHTDTNQIYMNAKKQLVKIETPKSELISSSSGKRSTLGAFKLISSSTPASIGVCSLDGKDIQQSSRLILCYATQEANSGMKANFDQRFLFDEGTLPLLLKTGKLKAELKLEKSKKFKLYPLALNGERRAEIPTKFEDGKLLIDIDTSSLPNGATTMFEIVEDAL